MGKGSKMTRRQDETQKRNKIRSTYLTKSRQLTIKLPTAILRSIHHRPSAKCFRHATVARLPTPQRTRLHDLVASDMLGPMPVRSVRPAFSERVAGRSMAFGRMMVSSRRRRVGGRGRGIEKCVGVGWKFKRRHLAG